MALVPLYDSVVSEDTANRLVALDGSTVEVLLRSDDSPAELFDDEDGTSPAANPVTVDASGRFACWVEGGQYNLSVTTPAGATSVHPVDLSTGGVDDTSVGVMHKAEDETVTGVKTFTPETVSPAISLNPITDGYFMDFVDTPPGVIPDDHDPGTPHWFDSVTIGTGATMVYANDALLSPLPGAIKIGSTSSAASYGTWAGLAYRDLTTHYGRFYFYMDTNIAANVIPALWTNVGSIRVRSSDRKFEILNSGSTAQTLDNADTKSTNALTAATWYRFEWKIVQSTTVGTITVKLFSGHSTSPIETRVTNAFNNGALPSSVSHGMYAAANLASGYIRLAGLAGGCLAYPGPYAGTAANLQVMGADGISLAEWLPGGQLILRGTDNYQLGSGGDPKATVRRGEPVFRTHPKGLMMGGNYGIGNPMTKDDTDTPDIYFDLQNKRISARSYNLKIINDPADINFERRQDPSVTPDSNTPWAAVNTNFWKVGRSAVWSTASKTVTFHSADMVLSMRDAGHGLELGGEIYDTAGSNLDIDTINGPQSLELTTFPTTSSDATTATGVNAINSTSILCASTTGFSTPQASTTATGVNATNSATINCASTTGFASLGYAYLAGVQFFYSGKTATSFTGCGPHAATTGGETIAYELVTAYLAGTPFTYTGVDATHFLGCGSHAATTGGEAITQGNWGIKGFPYPAYTTGVGAGPVGQLKYGPYAYPYMGKATAGMNTQTGTMGVAVAFTGTGYTWTTADVGRRVLINDNPLLTGNASSALFIQDVCSTTVNGAQALSADPFNVVSTAGFADSGKAMCGTTAFRYTGRTATSFTGTTGVPVTSGGEAIQALRLNSNVLATLVDVSYRVAGGEQDQAQEPVQTLVNVTVDTNVDNCNYGTSAPACSVGSADLKVKMNPEGILFINTTSGGYTATPQETMFKVRSNGTFGHGLGATVTQLTSKSTGVTINTGTGQITMHNATLNAGTSVSFTVTNSVVNEEDVVILSIKSGATAASYQAFVDAVADGSFRVHLRNTSGSNLSEALVLNYATLLGQTGHTT